MDKDTADLITQLCTRAGMIMEDASVVALSVKPTTEANFLSEIDELGRFAGHIISLIEAARVIANA